MNAHGYHNIVEVSKIWMMINMMFMPLFMLNVIRNVDLYNFLIYTDVMLFTELIIGFPNRNHHDSQDSHGYRNLVFACKILMMINIIIMPLHMLNMISNIDLYNLIVTIDMFMFGKLIMVLPDHDVQNNVFAAINFEDTIDYILSSAFSLRLII
jgi:hypothetical protein